MKTGVLFAFGCSELASRDDQSVSSSKAAISSPADEATSLGQVKLRTSGPLGDRLGGSVELELALPARVETILQALSEERPEARAVLFSKDRAIAAVYRAEKLLAPAELIRAGDVLDIVVAVSGG